MTVSFELDGQEFMALNGGPHFTFSPAISFMANCKTQEKWMSCGKSSQKAELRSNAAGLETVGVLGQIVQPS